MKQSIRILVFTGIPFLSFNLNPVTVWAQGTCVGYERCFGSDCYCDLLSENCEIGYIYRIDPDTCDCQCVPTDAGTCTASWSDDYDTCIATGCNAPYAAVATNTGGQNCACTCQNLIIGTCGQNAIDTALGCIPTDPRDFTVWFLVRALGIAGGVATLLIISAGITLTIASGNPGQIQKAKTTLMAAIAGLLLIAFSLFILNLIGVSILNIPGF